MDKYFVADTNTLLQDIGIIQQYKIVLLSHTLRELDKHKTSHRGELAYKARQVTRYIKNNKDKFHFDMNDYDGSDIGDKSYQDNNIIKSCLVNGYGLITNDILMGFKAEGLGIEVVESQEKIFDEGYTGVRDLYLDDSKESQELLASIYQNPTNVFDLVKNQYLCIWDKNKPTFDSDGKQTGFEPIDQLKFDGESIVKLKYKNIDNGFMGKIKPINVKQKLMFDMLQNKDLTVKSVFGTFGVGKDFVMISHAVNLMLQGKIDKLVWIRNNVEVKDSNPIGFLPNSLEDKLKPFVAPLMDHLGGQEGLDEFMRSGRVEIQHLGFLRGRDIKNSIIYVTECQSNTKEHIQLLLGRVGENSQLWLNGDMKQVDDDKFKYSNGVNALKRLKGNNLYGQVTLDKIERSETAKLADLL